MNRFVQKQFLGIAAVLALAVGLYTAVDVVAQGRFGGHMMATQPGSYGYHGMGPGSYGHHGMGPGMMGGADVTGFQGMGPGMMGGAMSFSTLTTDTQAVDRYLTGLKTRLAITTDQEPAWQEYSAAFKTQAIAQTDIHNTMHGTVAQAPQERTEQHLTAMGTLIGHRKTVFQACRSLVMQLDNVQQTTANQLSWSCSN